MVPSGFMRFFIGLFFLLTSAAGQNQPLFGFLPNTGQFPPSVRFVRYSTTESFFYLTGNSFVLSNHVRVQLAGINPNSQPVGVSPTATIYNFYPGNDPSKWMTNMHAFGGVKLAAAYPGIDAEFTTASAVHGFIGQGAIALTIAPNADPSVIRLNVLDTGVTPFLGPGGVWFAGGSIPGVFVVSAQASQPSGGTSTAITCNVVIDSDGTLSVQLPNRNLALETDLAVMFPDYDLLDGPPPPPILASALQYPVNLNEDGVIPNPGCVDVCQKPLVASLDNQGNPKWVTVLSGSGMDHVSFAAQDQSGIVASGTTSSSDFPVSGSAPVVKPGSSRDVWLAYLDAASGQWRDGTYTGLPAPGQVLQQVIDPGGDAVAGGSSGGIGGFIIRWQPSQNRFVYSIPMSPPPVSLLLDANSNLYYAALTPANTQGSIVVGELDPIGKTIGVTANVPLATGALAAPPLLQPAAGGVAWLAYALFLPGGPAGQSLWLTGVSLSTGQELLNRQIAQSGAPQNIGLTPLGNVKTLVIGPSPDEAVTPDASLVGLCLDTSYFAVWSPSGQLVYGSYVPTAGFNFTAQNESAGTPAAAIGCLASAANRLPTSAIAPGELITLIGGGFGPTTPLQTPLQANGTYPTAAGGFSVKIGGLDAPVLGVARGELSVQAPYETPILLGQTIPVEVFENGQTLNTISTLVASYAFSLFDTGDRNNSLNLPALAALNQDGTANSPTNPAAVGTVVSLFGTGLGALSPPLITGGLNPTPPAGSLSVSSLYKTCFGCTSILYLGSAPGLSTGVQQVNVGLPAAVPGTGVRPQGISVAVSGAAQGLFVFEASGVVFVQ
jgi:uncharacterized protein (TIGR03437 family)